MSESRVPTEPGYYFATKAGRRDLVELIKCGNDLTALIHGSEEEFLMEEYRH